MNYESLTNEELDRLIHERLFPADHASLCYSSLWESASYVVDAMRGRVDGFVFDATTGILGLWEASFIQVLPSKELAGATEERLLSSEVDASLPRAICLAALRALDE